MTKHRKSTFMQKTGKLDFAVTAGLPDYRGPSVGDRGMLWRNHGQRTSVSAQNVSHAKLCCPKQRAGPSRAAAMSCYWINKSLYRQQAVPFVLALPDNRLLAR